MEKKELTHEELTLQVKVLMREQRAKYLNSPSSLPDFGLTTKQVALLFSDPHQLPDAALKKVIKQLRPTSKFVTVSTANFEAIQRINKEAQDNYRMIGLLGYPGAGKTDGHDYYRMHSPNSFKVEATSSMKRREFLKEILSQLGVYYEGSLYEMIGKITHELSYMEKPLMIIDEVSKLNHNSLMDLHDLRNRTMGIAGIVLSGCEYFKTNLNKEKNRNKQGIPEFYSRVQSWYELEPITRAEIKAICEANGITDEATIKDFQRSKNYRELYNAILNQNDNIKPE